MTMTKLSNMINPEVLASMVDGELEFALKFTNLATVDNTLVGRPGNTVSLPAYKMIGEAVEKVVTERLRGNVPKTTTSSSVASITKEQFKKMDLMQRQELFNNDRELYNELTK